VSGGSALTLGDAPEAEGGIFGRVSLLRAFYGKGSNRRPSYWHDWSKERMGEDVVSSQLLRLR
jgi:hypothetical protein